MNINVYQIKKETFSTFLPRFLNTLLSKTQYISVICNNDAQVSSIDDLLWVFSSLSFLPHCTYKDTEYSYQSRVLIEISYNNLKRIPVLLSLTDITALPVECKQAYIIDTESKRLDVSFAQGKKIQIFVQNKTGGWEKQSQFT